MHVWPSIFTGKLCEFHRNLLKIWCETFFHTWSCHFVVAHQNAAAAPHCSAVQEESVWGGACRAYSLMDSAYVASCRKFHTCCHPLKAQQPPFIDDSDSIPKAKASGAGKAIENVSRRTGQDILLRKCLTRDISRWKLPSSEFLNLLHIGTWLLGCSPSPIPYHKVQVHTLLETPIIQTVTTASS